MTGDHLTVVSFHAHPDDEALYTGGTLAKAAADGHRVVIVVATLGERGLTDPDQFETASLGERRGAELQASADRLGCARLVVLGYADSGSEPRPITTADLGHAEPRPESRPATDSSPASRRLVPFADVPDDEAALLLADVLMQEQADVLTTYDAAGGYGHPDHRKVHLVGARAADIAGTPIVLEATIDRTNLTRAVRWLRRLSWIAPGLALPDFDQLYTARADLTHRIDVRSQLDAKRSAMQAHASQATSSSGERTLAFLLRLPEPLARRVLGTEWYVERGRPATGAPLTDIFASLRR